MARTDKLDEDTLLEQVLEAGAEDLDTEDGEFFRIYTAPEELHMVKESLEALGVEVASVEIDMEPSTAQKLEGKKAAQMIRLMEAFDDQDDVQNVWSNFDIDDEDLEDA